MDKLISILFLFIINNVFSQSKPQEPIPPFPYKSEEIIILNTNDSVNIGATLTIPQSGTKHGVAILISGSGAQNRDSELLGHKPFLFISDFLTRKNIATLRMDDRGVGTSTGDYSKATLSDLSEDVEYVIAYLKKRNDIDINKIGLIGHSLGGTIAPIVSVENNDIAYVIMLAGSGIRGDKLMLKQKELIETKLGATTEMVAMGQENMKELYKQILDSNNSTTDLKDSLIIQLKNLYGNQISEIQLNTLVKQLTTPWLVDFIRHDPYPTLKKVKCPLLALNGSNDLQIPSEVNLEAIKNALMEGGNKNVETIEYPNLNHLFQESESGLPNEYGTIEQTFSPQVVEKMASWLKGNGMIE